MIVGWLFTQNSTTASSCRHAQIILSNDEVPALCCRSCGKAWTFVPASKTPQYCPEDDPKYPGMLDNRGWSNSTRVTMVDDHVPSAVKTRRIPLGSTLIVTAIPGEAVCETVDDEEL